MARFCGASRLGLCINSEWIDEKQIVCMDCSTPYALTDLRDTYGLLESKTDISSMTDQVAPFMNGIRPLSAITVSYLQLTYSVGDCVDALQIIATRYIYQLYLEVSKTRRWERCIEFDFWVGQTSMTF